MGDEQRQTVRIVELAVKIDDLGFESKAVEHAEQFREDRTGGVAIGETAHRQRVAFVAYAGVECAVSVERGCASFGK